MDSLAAIGTAADLVIQFQTLSGEGAVIYFNEGELRACDTVSDTLLETLETCFSPTAEPQIHPAPSFEGRSNLWTALAETHGALASLSSRFERVDLVVVTGGPDDCPPPDAGDCGLPCANTVDVEHVRELVAQGQQPGGTPLRVSFLHIDVSRQGPDPEQLDIACRSGGHYLFAPELSVNSDPDGVTRIFRELLHTGPGYWRAVVETLRLRQMDEQLGQVTGKFVLKPEAELSRFRQERLFQKQTGIGQQELFLRPACSPEVGCPDLGLSCSPKSLTCDAETPDPCR